MFNQLNRHAQTISCTPSRMKPAHSQYWHFDKTDNLWECNSTDHDIQERLNPCEFVFD